MYNLIKDKPQINPGPLHTPIHPKPYNNILELVGNTPLVKLNKIPQDYGLSCNIYQVGEDPSQLPYQKFEKPASVFEFIVDAKCEFMNPTGSVKDRVAYAMMCDAERKGQVYKNTVFVEATTGNAGIGIAFNASLKGYKCVLVTQDKNAGDKINTARLLGADVIQTKDDVTAIARRIKDDNPDTVVMLDQFENDVNPRTHYENTGEEIANAMGSRLDMVVMGAGSGGTMSGIGHKVKNRFPNCLVIGAEPHGSIMLRGKGKSHPYLLEGIGGTTTPIVLDKSVMDDVEVVNDKDAFLMAREIAYKEGLLCGEISGCLMVAAIRAATKRKLGAGKRVVVMFTDGIRNYMSKFVCDQWMEAHLFMDPPKHTMKWWTHPITKLHLRHKFPVVDDGYTCAEVLRKLIDSDVAVVVNNKGWFVGAVSKDSMRIEATNPMKLPGCHSEEFNFDDLVINHLAKDCYTLAKNGEKGVPSVGLLSRILDITPFVVIGEQGHDDKVGKDYFIPVSVAIGDDVLDYIFSIQHNCII